MNEENYSPLRDAPRSATPVIDGKTCTACGRCVETCPSHSLALEGGRVVVQTEKSHLGCIACGQCMAACPTGAVGVTGRRMKLEDAYPLPPAAKRASAEAVEGLFAARRSCRHFKEQEIDRALIERLLAMTAQAPMGFPPTDVGVVVVHGRERVQELAGDLLPNMKKWLFFGTTPGRLLLRTLMGRSMANLMQHYVLPVVRELLAARQAGKDCLFYDAPAVLLFHYPASDSVDCAVACSYASIAAESLGLGSCMIGTVRAALERDKALKEKWGVPAENVPHCALILGHPALAYVKGVRRRFASVGWR